MSKKIALYSITYWLVLLAILLVCNTTNGQKIERFSNSEGFNQNTIIDIAQDAYGLLWFATPNGLIKYDGYAFETYTSISNNGQSIANNYIDCLLADDNNLLWIGHEVGVNCYIPKLEAFVEVPLPSNTGRITEITIDKKGRLWFAGCGTLFLCTPIDVAKGKFQISKNLVAKSNLYNCVTDINFIDDQNALFTSPTGLYKVSLTSDVEVESLLEASVQRFHTNENAIITSVKYINGLYWLGTSRGLHKAVIDGNNLKLINTLPNLKNTAAQLQDTYTYVNDIYVDDANTIWVATKNQGLFQYSDEKQGFINFEKDAKNQQTLSSNFINAVLKDNHNILWIGTAQGGLCKLDVAQKSFINYAYNPYAKDGLSGNLITTLQKDSVGFLWGATYNKSLFRSKQKVTIENYNQLTFSAVGKENKHLRDALIKSVYQDKKGFLWIGTEAGLFFYDYKSNAVKKINTSHKGVEVNLETISAIKQLGEEYLFLGGDKLTLIKNPWKQLSNKNNVTLELSSCINMEGSIVQTILVGRSNVNWLGTKNGLFKFSIKEGEVVLGTHYKTGVNKSVSLLNNNIFSLYADDKSTLWVGTFGGGLLKVSLNEKGNPTSSKNFRKNNGLPDDAVYGILPDGDKYIWISTDMGLCRLELATNKIEVFDVRDGLPNNNFRQNAYFKDEYGLMYFGGLNGLTVFDPSKIELHQNPPRVLITELKVDNKEVKVGQKIDGEVLLTNSIVETEQLEILQKQQTISFHILVQHTALPSKNRVAYKLENFNEDWIEKPDGKVTATYTNLSSGTYTFLVKGANGDGVWSETVTRLVIKVIPPWYFSWWGISLFVFLGIVLIIWSTDYFVRLEKLKERLKYEKLDKERMDIITQGKFRFFTNISHEFRTPLTLIAGPLERVMDSEQNSENANYLAIIQKNTKRLLNLVDQLITFRQAEQGKINLHLTKNTLEYFLSPTIEAFEDYAIEKNINFFAKNLAPNEEVVIDVEKTERIIFNLLSNSFKNTPPLGSITVEADVVHKEGKKMIAVNVIDTGKGIPAKYLDTIFERFYQLGNSEDNISGGGVGLAFCKSLVDVIGGSISVESEPNVKTKFSVLLHSQSEKKADETKLSPQSKSFIKSWVPLPADNQDRKPEFAQNKQGVYETSEKGYTNKFTLLVVENEVDVQNFLTTSLSKNYKVLQAMNGVEGLEKIKANRPHLVITDVMMPEMDGFELTEKIKLDPELCHIPVLMLTALEDKENLIRGIEFGANEYISKPFSIKYVEERIKKLIENNLRLKAYFSKNSLIPEREVEIPSRDKDFLKSLNEIIEKHLSESDFGVEELAREIGLSTSHFYRRLKQLTGQIPNAYIRNYRLQRAAEYLRNSHDCTVAEVMYKIGIESNSYFSTAFKKVHGITPSGYVKKVRG